MVLKLTLEHLWLALSRKIYIASFTLTDGIGVRPLMSISSTPASNAPQVKFAASTNQSLIIFTVNSLQEVAVDFLV